MFDFSAYITFFPERFPQQQKSWPWEITQQLSVILENMVHTFGDDYIIKGHTAVHKTVVIEQNVTIKGPFIAGPGCFIAANTYFREGVFLGGQVRIGPGSEIKSSIVLDHTAVAHLNYIGNSIIGTHVNFEAGSVLANHYNERHDKKIEVLLAGQRMQTGAEKFGALVGDGCKIGANAVLSPGTILTANSIVKRLELVEQLK
jgi:NDP-sugar pyrophosphorylase family protein